MYFLGPDEKGMPRDCPEFFGPDFAAGSGRRVLNHTGAKLLNNFSYPNLLSVRFLMHCKHSRPKNWGRKTRGNLGAFPFHPDRGSKILQNVKCLQNISLYGKSYMEHLLSPKKICRRYQSFSTLAIGVRKIQFMAYGLQVFEG